MNYFITGATGLLGSSLVNKLSLKKNKLTCLIHQNKNLAKKSIKIVAGDLLNYRSLLIGSKNADIIIHAAAAINVKHPSSYYLVNFQGTKNLVKAAIKNQVKLFVYISSWAVNPKAGDYANSKLLAEKEVKKFPNYIIIRPSDVYSKKQGHLVNLISLIKSLRIIPIIGDGQYKVSPLYVEDLSNAILKLLEKNKKNCLFIILGPKIYTFNELVILILKALKSKKPIIHIPKNLIFPLIYVTNKFKINFPLSLERFKRLTTAKVIENVLDFKEIGIKPLDFEVALAKFLI